MRCALALVALLAIGRTECHAVVAVGEGATGITTTIPGIIDPALSMILAEGAMTNCFLLSIRVGGIELCSTPLGFPLPCVRMYNNTLANLLEASGKRSHFSIFTITTLMFIEAWAEAEAALPTMKKIGQDMSDYVSASGRVNARTIAPPLANEYFMSLLDNSTMKVLCNPQTPKLGYLYFAEGDELSIGSMWRSIISPYYLNAATSGISFYAKAMEVTGMCSTDVNFLLCMGGFGTKYPTAGDVSAGSPALRLVTGMWRAQEIHAAPVATYGPYDMSLGFEMHATMHMPQSLIAGSAALLPPYSPGSYMQWMYPGLGGAPVGHSEATCFVLGIGPGTSPQVAAQMLSEMLNDTWIEEDTLSFAYWARWTCCNWCVGSPEAAAQHLVPERGYSPVLTRIP